MIYLLLDIFLSYLISYPTFLILLNILIVKKNNWPTFILITLILDLLILNTYFLNTIILEIIFFIYKKLKVKKVNFFTYFISLILIFFSYTIILMFLNKYSLSTLFKFFLVNIPLYILLYPLIKKRLVLAR